MADILNGVPPLRTPCSRPARWRFAAAAAIRATMRAVVAENELARQEALGEVDGYVRAGNLARTTDSAELLAKIEFVLESWYTREGDTARTYGHMKAMTAARDHLRELLSPRSTPDA